MPLPQRRGTISPGAREEHAIREGKHYETGQKGDNPMLLFIMSKIHSPDLSLFDAHAPITSPS